ncbi:TPA: phage tail protein, partial [Yersinia enterocolitica]|nr:phage tail protein [Yersinia enterocolitica]
RHIAIPTTNIYSVSGGTTTQTVLGVSPVAPPNAKQIDIVLTANETVAGNGVALNIASSTSGIGQFGAVSTVTGQTAITTGTLALIESQRLYFSMSNTNPGTYIIAGRGYSL